MPSGLLGHERSLLSAVLSRGLSAGSADVQDLSRQLNLPLSVLVPWMEQLSSRGLIELMPMGFRLTAEGRSLIRVVLAGGVFDIIHPGHVYTLEKARSLGDTLVVVVARDSTVERMKGRLPMHGEALRLRLVSSLRAVDVALLGSESDIMDTVEMVRPDIIALGYDQAHDEHELVRRGAEKGLKFEVVRLDSPYPNIKTSGIRMRLGDL